MWNVKVYSMYANPYVTARYRFKILAIIFCMMLNMVAQPWEHIAVEKEYGNH